ncbi:MAG: glycoside hydrolase family 3 N-terminal domain-containing protein [Bacteroidota bacterium]
MYQIRAILLGFILCLWSTENLYGQAPFESESAVKWADSLMRNMTLEQKLGQVFMVDLYTGKSGNNFQTIASYVRTYHLGGVICMKGEPRQQVAMLNRLQEASDIPLLVGQDAEWGLSMRLDNTLQFPKNMTLGAIRNDSLIRDMGFEIGKQLRRVGVHMNFAPVVDINNNPLNPVINHRSFGENKFLVSRKGLVMSKGMMQAGVFPCIKHFPGHGDTDTDSHRDLPVMYQSRTRLDTLEFYPFSTLIRSGIPALMVAHLHVPQLDSTQYQPASLSPKVVSGILRDSMNFQGLVFTDALNMGGITRHYGPAEAALRSLKAGNDVLVFPGDVPRTFQWLIRAVQEGEFPMAQLDERVQRILMAKYQLGLSRRPDLSEYEVLSDINTASGRLLNKQLYESALTLVKNDRGVLPINNLDQRKIAYIQIGGRKENLFEKTLKKYAGIDSYYLPANFSPSQRLQLLKSVSSYNTTITGLFGMNNNFRRNYGVSAEARVLLDALSKRNAASVLCVFGNPYSLEFFGKEDAILLAYEEAQDAQRAAASAVFGGIGVNGRLPVTVSDSFPVGTGEVLNQVNRFGFALPEEVGMNGATLAKIDSIANMYIRKGAMPGCAVLAMRGRDIVYERGFGSTNKLGEVVDTYRHTYDVASVTKVAVTTLAIMRLVDEGRLNLDRSIGAYLPEFRKTDLAILTPRSLLQHTGGLPGWIPFFRDTYSDERRTRLDPYYYSVRPTKTHSLQIAPRLYVNPIAQDSIWERIGDLEVRRTTRYRYSDIGFILLGKIVEKVTQEPLEMYLQRNFYAPLGMNQSLFNPAKHGLSANCPPTEKDRHWRFTTIQGYTHDPMASLLGGVAGHAGLFSNVYDLGKLMLMLKEDGMYGGRMYVKPQTIQYFSKRQSTRSRRGLGFDKPEILRGGTHPTSRSSSGSTFGHTGFTGTAVWVDPQFDLVYVFLSNRTYPNSNNRKLINEHVRTKIMDVLYESIFAYSQKRGFEP